MPKSHKQKIEISQRSTQHTTLTSSAVSNIPSPCIKHTKDIKSKQSHKKNNIKNNIRITKNVNKDYEQVIIFSQKEKKIKKYFKSKKSHFC